MTLTEFKRTMRQCAQYAKAQNPTSIDLRARAFVAILAGHLEGYGEPDLSKIVFSVLDNQSGPIAATQPGAAHA